jgi:hypothetical protein
MNNIKANQADAFALSCLHSRTYPSAYLPDRYTTKYINYDAVPDTISLVKKYPPDQLHVE